MQREYWLRLPIPTMPYNLDEQGIYLLTNLKKGIYHFTSKKKKGNFPTMHLQLRVHVFQEILFQTSH